VRIVDLGSMSRAAGALHVAQSALSQHVSALEDEFQTPLLHRTPRGVSPTEAGMQLYRHAHAILQQADDAKAAVAMRSSEPTGCVAIGVPLSVAAPLAMPIFDAVRSGYPGIKLQIHEELSGTILEWVKNGRLALGIAFDDGNLEGLTTVPILEERLFLVVNPKSRLAKRKVISLREVQGLELVLPTRGYGVRDRIEAAMLGAGLPAARVAAEMNSFTMLKQAVEVEMGATILTWPSITTEMAERRLAAVEIVRPAITRITAICCAANGARTRAAECVHTLAVEAIRRVVQHSSWRGVRFLASEVQ
jgi:LysR family nitrogen assimilation transcriptional regulator